MLDTLTEATTRDAMEQAKAQSVAAALAPVGYRTFGLPTDAKKSGEPSKIIAKKDSHPTPPLWEPTGPELLDLVKNDIHNDVSGGPMPLSGVNYLFINFRFFQLFEQIEERLRAVRNRSYIRAYETDARFVNQKRVGLTLMALEEEDEELLRIIAEEFENPRAGFLNHAYWKEMDEDGTLLDSIKAQKENESRGVPDVDCVVM